ncbi:hypothetical protein [Hyphococcus sp.]|uniref:hypothetical protein n=1 Tax=Hyphococcus sp. TaxID=2038636 RepID=UPI00208CD385|nr:MAG: hypothetical protein DHS20C04_32250 [Marinicaulis sp.]
MDNYQHTVDRLKDRFGSINKVAQAAGRKQNTVSGWRKRPGGVPLDDAVTIAQNAMVMGVDVSYEEIVAWIGEDARQRRVAA